MGSPSSMQPMLAEMLCEQDYSNLFKRLRSARTHNEKCSLPLSPVPTHQEALLAILYILEEAFCAFMSMATVPAWEPIRFLQKWG